MKIASVVAMLSGLLAAGALSAPEADAAEKCTITMNSSKTGVSGTCKGGGVKKFRLIMTCATAANKPVNPPVNGPWVKAGKKSSISCPRGKKIWLNEYTDSKNKKHKHYDYGYIASF